MALSEVKPTHIVRALSVFIGGDKQGEVKSGSYKIDTGVEAQITDGGYSGHSDGQLMATVDIKQLVGVTSTSFTAIHRAVMNRDYISIMIPVEGSFLMFIGKVKSLGLSWDHSKNSAEGDATFEGGQVQLQ